MAHCEASERNHAEDKPNFIGSHHVFNSTAAVHTANITHHTVVDTPSQRVQCCLCHSEHTSSQHLHQHYVQCHSPHQLSMALLHQQQCFVPHSLATLSVTTTPSENRHQPTNSSADGRGGGGGLLEQPQRYWNGTEERNETDTPFPASQSGHQENVFAIQSSSLNGEYHRDLVGNSSCFRVLNASLRHCPSSLVKCPQKPTTQKIMSQMMGMAGEEGDDWPDLGDDITLIDDEDLLSSLDLFPNLLDFVIELDAKEESGALTVQKPDLHPCPQKHLGYPAQHSTCKGVGRIQHSIQTPDKRIDALQGKSTHESDYQMTYCSDDPLPLALSCKRLHTDSGAKTLLSGDSVYAETQALSNNALVEGVMDDHDDTCQQIRSGEHNTSTVVMINNNMHSHLNTPAPPQNQDISHEHLSSLPIESVHLNSSEAADVNSLSDPRGLSFNCNYSKSQAIIINTGATNNMNDNSVITLQPAQKRFLSDETISTNLEQLSPPCQTRDLHLSAKTASCSLEKAVIDTSEPYTGKEDRFLSFNDGIHFNGDQSIQRFDPKFITTQAPTQKLSLNVSITDNDSRLNFNTSGSIDLGVQTSIQTDTSLPDNCISLKSNNCLRSIPPSTSSKMKSLVNNEKFMLSEGKPEYPKTKQRVSILSRCVKRRKTQVKQVIAQNQFEENTGKLGNSLIGVRHPTSSMKTKVVKTSSGRVVKSKKSNEFIYDNEDKGVFSQGRLGVSSKVSISRHNSDKSLKITKGMMGSIELNNTTSHSTSELPDLPLNTVSCTTVVRVPVYTDAAIDLMHAPKLVVKDDRCTQYLVSQPSKSSSFLPEPDCGASTPALFNNKHNTRNKDERRQQFLCHLCWEQSPTLSSLTAHLEADHAEWTSCFACRCGSTFTSEDSFRTHWRVKHRNFLQVKYTCRVCGEIFQRENAFNAHLRVIHPDYKVVCLVCEKRFVHMKSLRVHMAVHTKKQVFVCPYCPKTYLLRYSFNRHFVNHFFNSSCSPCNKSFKSKQSYEEHMRRHRTSKSLGRASILNCNSCGHLHEETSVTAANDSGLGHHKVCVSCNKGLYKNFPLTNDRLEPSTAAVRVNTPGHEPRRRQKCPHCQSWVLDLAKHIRRVHRQPTVACDVCGVIVKKECLPSHKDRAHARVGGLPCDHCGKTFANALSLREHINRVNKKIKSVLEDII